MNSETCFPQSLSTILKVASTHLLDHNVYLIPILHVEVLWSLVLVQSLAIEEEAYIVCFELG